MRRRGAEPADAGSGPDELAELEDLARLVRGGIAGLSMRDATALTLATQFVLTPKEMAPTLGVSPGAAKVILCRARRRLRNGLAREMAADQSGVF